ncbi:hypothetical protein, partial [Lachnoclostridium sp. An169]|uniref:hypothetical protein n=1 Tax=Lachnoclostridium sp. An169 TaxID=1965569 RepID=UPI001950A9EC
LPYDVKICLPEYEKNSLPYDVKNILPNNVKKWLTFANSLPGSDPLPLSGSGSDPVVKGAYCNVVFTAPVSICHAALAAFIDKPDLFRHRNTGFASTCHNLASIIVVK